MFQSIKTRLAAMTFILVILVTLVLIAASYFFIQNNIISNAVNSCDQLATQFCNNMDIYLENAQRESDSVANTSIIRLYKYGDTFTFEQNRDEIKKIFWDATLEEKNIDDISILYNTNKVISLFNMYSPADLKSICYYYDKNEIVLTSRFVPDVYYNRNGAPALSCVKSIVNPATNSDEYFLVTSITVDDLFSTLRQINFGQGSGSCLVGSNGLIQYSTNSAAQFTNDLNALINKPGFNTNSSSISKISGTKYIISIHELTSSELGTVVFVPLSTFTSSVNALRIVMLLTLIILVIPIIIICVKFANHMTKPIVILSNHIEKVDESLCPIPVVQGSTETNTLFMKFNEMIERIEALIQKNEEENKLKRKAELYALQSQIKPHFIYNTLDAINALAIINNEKDISKMITSFASLLRILVHMDEEFIAIKDEIKHVKAYLTIMRIRYEDKFETIFDVEEEILNLHIIKLILQPLVENAIIHGIELKDGKGRISIQIKKTDELLHIEVMDDGVGTDELTVKEINENLTQGENPKKEFSVGLYNVNERIRLYYGGQYTVHFFSKLNQGSKVCINIPLKEDDTDVQNSSLRG